MANSDLTAVAAVVNEAEQLDYSMVSAFHVQKPLAAMAL
jgi:hypothetical protein